MFQYGSTADDNFTIRYVRRGGRWVPKVDRKADFWPTVFEWVAITALACLIMAMGPIVGYLSVKPALDKESRIFAETSLKAVASSWNSGALMARAAPELAENADAHAAALRVLKGEAARGEGCRGHSRISPFSPNGLITAHYLCNLKLGERQSFAAMTLRDEPDDWKITGFYVQR